MSWIILILLLLFVFCVLELMLMVMLRSVICMLLLSCQTNAKCEWKKTAIWKGYIVRYPSILGLMSSVCMLLVVGRHRELTPRLLTWRRRGAVSQDNISNKIHQFSMSIKLSAHFLPNSSRLKLWRKVIHSVSLSPFTCIFTPL